jgi:electron transfer flavoprotein beta subunit
VLFEAMALGADRGVLICDPALKGSDTIATSTVLAAAIKRLAPFDLVLFGTQTSDSDSGQVGPQTAALLDLPLVTWAHTIEHENGRLRVERRVDGFCEVYEVGLPAALTVHPRATSPKEPQLGRLETAFGAGKIERLNLADLGLTSASVGEGGSPTRILSIKEVKTDRKCRFIQGSIEEQTLALVGCLSEKGALR